MTYLQKNKDLRRGGGYSVLIIAFAVFVILIIFRMFFGTFFSSLFATIGTPLWKSRDAMTTSVGQTVASVVQSRSSLAAQISQLQMQLAEAQAKNLEFESRFATLSNFDLQSFLQPEHSTSIVVAKVLSRPPYTPFDSIIIDKGVEAQIVAGDAVYSSNGVAVGAVTLALQSSSQVFLYSSGGTITQAVVARTGETVTLRGIGGGNFEIQLPKEFDIVEGDTLTDSGTQRALIAQVSIVDADSSDSFKKVSARLPKNILQLQWVGVDTDTVVSF